MHIRSINPAFTWIALSCALLAGCSRQKTSSAGPSSSVQPEIPYFHVDAATAGSIDGIVRFVGAKPSAKPINMSDDPACVAAHHGKPYDESLVVGPRGGLANVFLYIEKGLEGKRFEVPNTPVMISQTGCWFVPRVLGIQVGQRLQVVNSDPVTHNIHPLAKVNREWNHSQGAGDPPIERHFTKPEVMIPIKCNIHSWMHAYIGVVDNPYFAVSDSAGGFRIPNLPPGTYTIAAWQEKFGAQRQTITVGPGGTAHVHFVFHLE
jgi:plastocyanin